MTDTPDRPDHTANGAWDTRDTADARWEKWERWRQGDLQLPSPEQLTGEQGLGEPGQPTRVPWRAREAILIFLLHILLAAVFTVPAALAMEDQDAATAVAILVTEIMLFATTVVWVRARYGLGLRALGFTGLTGKNIGIGLGVGVAGLLASLIIGGALTVIIESITGGPPPDPNQIPLIDEPTGAVLWLVGISVVLLAPLAEEAFFRGFVYGGLRRWAKVTPALLWSAVIFAIPHIEPIVLPAIFVLGIFLGWVVERRRSIVPAIVAHMAFNLFGFILLFLA